MVKENLIKAMNSAGFTPEVAEVKREFFDYTGYPKPAKKYMLTFTSENFNVEEIYFWMLGHAMNDWSLPYTEKITDIFAASRASSTFGDLQARMTQMQNQAAQLMATTANMSKELFKRVREMRQIRERLAYYKKADESKPLSERKKTDSMGAEATLKDIWINLVEGGGENPASVYGMARKVNFTILPDLFLQAPAMNRDEISKYVKDLDFNPAVTTALERKLYQFLVWKEQTRKELQFKENFQKKLLYQHYMSIKQNLNWVKPYLKHAKGLSLDNNLMDSYGIINSFQTSMVEIEVLVHVPKEKAKIEYDGKKPEDLMYHSVVIMHFLYQTTPSMDYHAKDSWQQKGPIHIGRVDANIRAYGWTTKQIEAYKKLKEDEDVELLEAIDYTLKDEKDLLGDDLKQILDEVREDLGKKLGKESEEEKSKKPATSTGAADPFLSIFKGLKEAFIDPFTGGTGEKKIKMPSKAKQWRYNESANSAKKSAEGYAKVVAWQVYKNYKKAHRMITW